MGGGGGEGGEGVRVSVRTLTNVSNGTSMLHTKPCARVHDLMCRQ